MGNRVFYGFITVIIGGFLILGVVNHKHSTVTALTGVVNHISQGNAHIAEGAKHAAYNSDLPSSGSHYFDASSPAPWGTYAQEMPAEAFLHNEEHGGIVIAYSPTLPASQVKQLQQLFASPSSDSSFSAGKFILMPRTENKKPIELASWTRTFDLNNFDKNKIEEFYQQNVANKRAPESFGGPRNKPINQAGA
ncbi:MAG: DUF3105 domain-containing protein [Candidatus Saccharimonadales bacterium]